MGGISLFLCMYTKIEQEGGRGNICFPVEEGWENRGFPRCEIVKRPGIRRSDTQNPCESMGFVVLCLYIQKE